MKGWRRARAQLTTHCQLAALDADGRANSACIAACIHGRTLGGRKMRSTHRANKGPRHACSAQQQPAVYTLPCARHSSGGLIWASAGGEGKRCLPPCPHPMPVPAGMAPTGQGAAGARLHGNAFFWFGPIGLVRKWLRPQSANRNKQGTRFACGFSGPRGPRYVGAQSPRLWPIGQPSPGLLISILGRDPPSCMGSRCLWRRDLHDPNTRSQPELLSAPTRDIVRPPPTHAVMNTHKTTPLAPARLL